MSFAEGYARGLQIKHQLEQMQLEKQRLALEQQKESRIAGAQQEEMGIQRDLAESLKEYRSLASEALKSGAEEIPLSDEHAEAFGLPKGTKIQRKDLPQFLSSVAGMIRATKEATPSSAEADAQYRELIKKQTLGQALTPDEEATKKAYEKQKLLVPATTANIRVEGIQQARSINVKDTKTGKVVPMNMFDFNRKSSAEPGRFLTPQYDAETQSEISAARASGREFAVGTEADQLQAFRTFVRHAADLDKFSKEFARTGSPLANKPLNWLRQNAAGNPQVAAFLAKIDPPAKEFESFLLNNRALYEEDRETVNQILNENLTAAQMSAVLRSFGETASARLHTLNLKSIEARGKAITIDRGTARDMKALGQDLAGFNIGDVEADTKAPTTQSGKGRTITLSTGKKVTLE